MLTIESSSITPFINLGGVYFICYNSYSGCGSLVEQLEEHQPYVGSIPTTRPNNKPHSLIRVGFFICLRFGLNPSKPV